MLHLPNDGYKIYEGKIYNQKVRDLVVSKRHHAFFDDRWAEIQRRDVVARDEKEAISLLAQRFPPEDGFVINDVFPRD
jgi:hypothetical protein